MAVNIRLPANPRGLSRDEQEKLAVLLRVIDEDPQARLSVDRWVWGLCRLGVTRCAIGLELCSLCKEERARRLVAEPRVPAQVCQPGRTFCDPRGPLCRNCLAMFC